MEKMEVPADTLPVRGATALVAAMPVPASPSAGAKGMPGVSRLSSRAAPRSVSAPASAPAGRTRGSTFASVQGKSRDFTTPLNFSIISLS